MSRREDPLMGLKCFSIAGRMRERRQRCLGMTDEERRWRAQWLKDQILSPEEPRNVPEYYKATTNVFRRLWKTPLYHFQNMLEPMLGKDGAYVVRHMVGKGLAALGATYLLVYYFKYHTNDFEVYRSVETWVARPAMYPDEPGYPNFRVKTPQEYYDQGFSKSVLAKQIQK